MAEPTEKEVLDFASLMKEKFAKRNAQIDHWRELRFCIDTGIKDEIPEEYRKTTRSRMTPVIQHGGLRAKAMLMSNAPRTVVRPPTPSMQPASTTQEKFLDGARAELEEKWCHVEDAITDSQIYYAAGVRKSYARRWKDYPKRRKGESADDYNDRTEAYKKGQPLREAIFYDSPPIDTYYWLGKYTDPDACCEIKMVNEYALAKEYGVGRGNNQFIYAGSGSASEVSASRAVEVIEFWNADWRKVVVPQPKGKEGLPLETLTWEHNWGRVPYFLAPAFETSDKRPEYQFVPLMWAQYEEADENNRLHTMHTNVAYFTGWPFYYVKTVASGELVLDPETNRPKIFAMVPGEVPQLGQGQEIVQIGLQAGEELLRAIAESDSKMQEYGLPTILSAESPGARTPGVGLQFLRRLAASLLDPLAQGRAQSLREMYVFWLKRLKDEVKEKIYVWPAEYKDALAFGPDDVISENVVVKIEPDVPADQIQLEAHGANLKEKGHISEREFQEEYRGKSAPEETLKEIEADRVLVGLRVEAQAQLLAQLGMVNAAAMLADGASAGQVMEQVGQLRSAGGGSGSPNQPRTPGVKQPVDMSVGTV